MAGHVERIAQAHHLAGHVEDLLQEIDGLALDRQFLTPVHRPEAVFQVVVVHRAQGVDVAVGTVVIGDHQTVLGDHAARAAESQGDHGVGEAFLLFIVDHPAVEFQAGGLHPFLENPVDGIDHPHAFIGEGAGGTQQQGRHEAGFFHLVI